MKKKIVVALSLIVANVITYVCGKFYLVYVEEKGKVDEHNYEVERLAYFDERVKEIKHHKNTLFIMEYGSIEKEELLRMGHTF